MNGEENLVPRFNPALKPRLPRFNFYARFPLTPTLSPGEREQHCTFASFSKGPFADPAAGFRLRRRAILPLLEGGGRGEREQDVRTQSTSIPARSFLIVFLVCFTFLLSGCSKPNRANFELPIYFTCDTHGRLEPCGCFSGQFGGLTRLKTVLDGEAKDTALRLDVGDAIAGSEDYDLIEYHYLLRAYAAMKFDALNIGHREAQLSAAQLQEIKKSSPVPIIGANLIDKASGKPIFDSYKIFERGGYRIAVIGVLDPRGIAENTGAGLTVGDMDSALTRSFAEVRGKADVIILLAFADEETLTKLAQQYYEANVILGGKVRQPSQDLKKENRSLIYFVTNESRALGILKLKLAEGKSPEPSHSEVRLMHDQIRQDKAFRQLANEYRDEVRRTKLTVDDPSKSGADMVPGVRAAAAFVGTQRCTECHKTAGAVWTKSGHAEAFQTLVMRKADADPKCISCHTIGYGSPSGYRREFGSKQLVNVGCESCHGPGSLHVRRQEGDKSIDFTYRPLGAGDCQKCHYGEFSRPFYWYEFWPSIKHGKEPVQAAAQLSNFH